jgi:L-fuconolactonase
MIVDCHQHFWDPKTHALTGLTGQYSGLRRRFSPEDLQPLLVRCGVDKTVAIQADDSTDDSLRLLRIAHRYPFIMSVVGWIDPDGTDPLKAIGELRAAPGGHTLAGIRFNARDRDDRGWLVERRPARSVRSVVDTGLVCELLMRPENALSALRLIEDCSDGRFVIDHLMTFPPETDRRSTWRRSMRRLAASSNVYLKISGLVDEAGPAGWRPVDFRSCVQYALETWEASRLMFGTDWPVCTIARTYEEVFEWSVQALEGVDPVSRDRILGFNAEECYRSSTGRLS